MRKVLITRYAAYGDHLHASFLPRLLKERAGFDHVAVEYNPKGYAIYKNNPFIDEHLHFDPQIEPYFLFPASFMRKRWEAIMTQGNFERHINLQDSIEYGYIAMEDQHIFYMSDEERRNRFGARNYYDQSALAAGFPEWTGQKAEVYFDSEEEAVVKRIYAERYSGKFVVLCNISGTSKHKLFYNAEAILKEFLACHKDAVVILVGDQFSREHFAFESDRIINRCGSFEKDTTKLMGANAYYPFRQSMMMAKHADLVIGAESGLMVAATALGAPTLQLMTAASIKNHGGGFPNDYSVQSPAACSPCHKGPYQYFGCPKFQHIGEEYPVCIRFDADRLLDRMHAIYALKSRQEVSV